MESHPQAGETGSVSGDRVLSDDIPGKMKSPAAVSKDSQTAGVVIEGLTTNHRRYCITVEDSTQGGF